MNLAHRDTNNKRCLTGRSDPARIDRSATRPSARLFRYASVRQCHSSLQRASFTRHPVWVRRGSTFESVRGLCKNAARRRRCVQLDMTQGCQKPARGTFPHAGAAGGVYVIEGRFAYSRVVSRPASIAIVVILVLCGTVDYLDRNLADPQVPAMFYGIVLSLVIWRLDRRLRKRRRSDSLSPRPRRRLGEHALERGAVRRQAVRG